MADEAAHMIRLSRETHTADTVQAINDLQKPRVVDVILPCYMIPHGLNKKFYGRSTEINTIRRILNPEGSDSLQAIAIYGLGGVGKTQLALHYANTFMRLYDVVAWISAETQIKLTQSLSDLTFRLGLHQEKEDRNAYNSIQKVRDWLNVSGKTFLLVFDNVENIELLDQIWPAGDRGSLILTTRSLTVASKRTMNVMKLKCFEGEDMYEMIYSLSDYRLMSEKDKAAAEEVCRLLDGLPLAAVQIGEFIRDRGCSYEELLKMYRKSAKKIFSRLEAPVGYNHTLDTVWEISIGKLSQEARTLHSILSFFDPDGIQEHLLTNPRTVFQDYSTLQFLFDELE